MATFEDVPQADSVAVYFCDGGKCKRPHVVLLDTNEHPIAQFVVPDPRPDGGGFLRELQKAMYRSAVERGGEGGT